MCTFFTKVLNLLKEVLKHGIVFQVRMLGSGRPFLVEIQNARRVPCEEDVKNIENLINYSENKLVSRVYNLYYYFF